MHFGRLRNRSGLRTEQNDTCGPEAQVGRVRARIGNAVFADARVGLAVPEHG